MVPGAATGVLVWLLLEGESFGVGGWLWFCADAEMAPVPPKKAVHRNRIMVWDRTRFVAQDAEVVAEWNVFMIGCSIFLVGGLKRAARCGSVCRAIAERLSKNIPANASRSFEIGFCIQIVRESVMYLTATVVRPDFRRGSCDNKCVAVLRTLDGSREICMGDLFQPWHLIILAGLAILLFGGKKLPELGKGLGEGLRGFKEGMKGMTDDVKGDAKTDVKPGDTAHVVTPKPDEAAKPPVA